MGEYVTVEEKVITDAEVKELRGRVLAVWVVHIDNGFAKGEGKSWATEERRCQTGSSLAKGQTPSLG